MRLVQESPHAIDVLQATARLHEKRRSPGLTLSSGFQMSTLRWWSDRGAQVLHL